jgi:DNA replication protein DnaC
MNEIEKILKDFNSMTPEQMAAHDAQVEERIKAAERREADERYRKSGVPERYWFESVDTYRATNEMQTRAQQSARGFIDAIKCGRFASLVMIGNAGTGKTHLACGIVRACGGKYRTAPDIVEELRRAKSFSATETEAKIIDYYGHTSLLVIDEIGRGINAVDEKYMIYQVLNARYNTRKPTVLISNHKKAEFLQYIGVAAADRLVESAEMIEMNGESFRRELRTK